MYKSVLNLFDTQVAIKLIKDNFENKLAKKLNLTRVSAPLFVMKSSVYKPCPSLKAYLAKAHLFHLASDWTISTSPLKLKASNVTGRSNPFK